MVKVIGYRRDGTPERLEIKCRVCHRSIDADLKTIVRQWEKINPTNLDIRVKHWVCTYKINSHRTGLFSLKMCQASNREFTKHFAFSRDLQTLH